jgi:uncharacterized protein (DUF697 family)
VTDLTAGPTSGKTTTEFWSVTLLQLFVILNQIFHLGIVISDEQAMTIVAGLTAAYTVGRSAVKALSKPASISTPMVNQSPAAPASGPSSGA